MGKSMEDRKADTYSVAESLGGSTVSLRGAQPLEVNMLNQKGNCPAIEKVELMPYHQGGVGKFEPLGYARPKINTTVPDNELKEAWVRKLRTWGVAKAVIG
jgi:hypothetical protein